MLTLDPINKSSFQPYDPACLYVASGVHHEFQAQHGAYLLALDGFELLQLLHIRPM